MTLRRRCGSVRSAYGVADSGLRPPRPSGPWQWRYPLWGGASLPTAGERVRGASPTAGKESRTPERYPGRRNQLFRRPVRAEDPDSSTGDHSLFCEFLKNRVHFIVVCHDIPQSLRVSPSSGGGTRAQDISAARTRAQDISAAPSVPSPESGFRYFAAMYARAPRLIENVRIRFR